jgi:hypothetical protein
MPIFAVAVCPFARLSASELLAFIEIAPHLDQVGGCWLNPPEAEL